MKEAENEYDKFQKLKEALAATMEALKDKKAKHKGLKVDFGAVKKRNADLASTISRLEEELKTLRVANMKLEISFKDSLKTIAQLQSRFDEKSRHAKLLEEQVRELAARAAVSFEDLTPRCPDLKAIIAEFDLLKGKKNQSTAETIEAMSVALRQAHSRSHKHEQEQEQEQKHKHKLKRKPHKKEQKSTSVILAQSSQGAIEA